MIIGDLPETNSSLKLLIIIYTLFYLVRYNKYNQNHNYTIIFINKMSNIKLKKKDNQHRNMKHPLLIILFGKSSPKY